jgi:hypothetical protein
MSAYQNAIAALQRPERLAGSTTFARKYIEENATLEEITNYENRLRVVNAWICVWICAWIFHWFSAWFSWRFAPLFRDLSLQGSARQRHHWREPASLSSRPPDPPLLFRSGMETENGPPSGSPDRAIPRTFVEAFEIVVDAKKTLNDTNEEESVYTKRF